MGCRKGLHHCAEHQGYLESAGPNIRVIRHRPGRSLSTKLSLSWAARTAQCEGCSFACCMDSSPAFTEHQGHPGWGLVDRFALFKPRLAEWTIAKSEPTEAASQNSVRGVFFDKKDARFQ